MADTTAQWADLATWVYSDTEAARIREDDTPTLPGQYNNAATTDAASAGDEAGDQAQPSKPSKPLDMSAPADAMRNMRGTLGHVSAQAARIPTPGGIGLLVLVLAFFWFAVVPVAANGKDTRLSLLWRMLLGQVTVPGDEQQAPDGSTADAFWGAVGGGVLQGIKIAAGAGAGPDGMPPEATPAPVQPHNMAMWARPRIPAYAYTPATSGRK